MDLTEIQRHAERDAVRRAEARYRELQDALPTAERRPGVAFLHRTIRPLAEAIGAEHPAILGGTGRFAAHALPLLSLPPTTLAFLALRAIFARTADGRDDEPPGYGELAVAIGKACRREWHLRRERADELEESELPNLGVRLQARNRNPNAGQRAREQADKFAVEGWGRNHVIALGGRLLDLAAACELLTIEEERDSERAIRRVHLAEHLARWVERARDNDGVGLLLVPPFLPMIVPPRPWHGPHGGGFLTTQDPELADLVKHRDHPAQLAALDEAARCGGLGVVCDAVNALQGTPWRLNEALHELLREAVAAGTLWPGLPDPARPGAIRRELRDREGERRALDTRRDALGARQRARRAAKKAKEETRDVRKARDEALRRDWSAYHAARRPLRRLEQERKRLRSRAAQLASTLAMCRRLAGDPAPGRADPRFHFPYQLDYRGRAYAMVAPLSPQGGDSARALLEFADGKPLGPCGAYWLAVHLANTYGAEKGTFRARVAWVRDHDGAIRDLARLADPAGGPVAARMAALPAATLAFWAGADKPWHVLAACREWIRRDEPGFVSRLPIALDASASGLQHLSALARDRAGAAATNLLRGAAPADIYGRVAEVLGPLVARDAAAGDARAATWAGLIGRGTVKRGVMTTPYGVTPGGLRRQLVAYLEGQVPGRSTDPWDDAGYLAGALEECIGAIVTKAPEVMAWLRDVATALVDTHKAGVAWTTPSGFPLIVAHYREDEERVTWTETDTKRTRELGLRRVKPGPPVLDRRKQRSTIAPNVVHALDAAHLMLTVRRLHAEGLRHFAVIHDSYGVHARDVPRLRRALREEFVGMYRAPLLEGFIDAQLAAAAKGDAAAPPAAAAAAPTPQRKRATSPGSQGAASVEGASTATIENAEQQEGKKPPPTLQGLRAALPSPGDLALEEVLRARYMFA